MNFALLLSVLVSLAVAVFAKAVLTALVQRASYGVRAKDEAIEHWREPSPPKTRFDGQQQAILQKWQRKFEGTMYDEDSQIAA